MTSGFRLEDWVSDGNMGVDEGQEQRKRRMWVGDISRWGGLGDSLDGGDI